MNRLKDNSRFIPAHCLDHWTPPLAKVPFSMIAYPWAVNIPDYLFRLDCEDLQRIFIFLDTDRRNYEREWGERLRTAGTWAVPDIGDIHVAEVACVYERERRKSKRKLVRAKGDRVIWHNKPKAIELGDPTNDGWVV